MRETLFRKCIFYLLLIGKIILLFFIHLEWETGGYSISEVIQLLAIMLPLFTIYTSVLFKEMLQNRYQTPQNSPTINKGLVALTVVLFGVYITSLLWVITFKPRGMIDLAQLQAVVAFIESVFGAYIGPLVFVFERR